MRRSHLLILLGLIAVAPAQSINTLQLAVDRSLCLPEFRGIHVVVRDGHITLTGSVPLLQTRLDAEIRLARLHGVLAVDDRLSIATPPVDDAVLKADLAHRLHNSDVSIDVQHGIVRLKSSGIATPFALEALSRTAETPGVQGIINNMTIRADLEVPLGTYSASTLP